MISYSHKLNPVTQHKITYSALIHVDYIYIYGGTTQHPLYPLLRLTILFNPIYTQAVIQLTYYLNAIILWGALGLWMIAPNKTSLLLLLLLVLLLSYFYKNVANFCQN